MSNMIKLSYTGLHWSANALLDFGRFGYFSFYAYEYFRTILTATH